MSDSGTYGLLSLPNLSINSQINTGVGNLRASFLAQEIDWGLSTQARILTISLRTPELLGKTPVLAPPQAETVNFGFSQPTNLSASWDRCRCAATTCHSPLFFCCLFVKLLCLCWTANTTPVWRTRIAGYTAWHSWLLHFMACVCSRSVVGAGHFFLLVIIIRL